MQGQNKLKLQAMRKMIKKKNTQKTSKANHNPEPIKQSIKQPIKMNSLPFFPPPPSSHNPNSAINNASIPPPSIVKKSKALPTGQQKVTLTHQNKVKKKPQFSQQQGQIIDQKQHSNAELVAQNTKKDKVKESNHLTKQKQQIINKNDQSQNKIQQISVKRQQFDFKQKIVPDNAPRKKQTKTLHQEKINKDDDFQKTHNQKQKQIFQQQKQILQKSHPPLKSFNKNTVNSHLGEISSNQNNSCLENQIKESQINQNSKFKQQQMESENLQKEKHQQNYVGEAQMHTIPSNKAYNETKHQIVQSSISNTQTKQSREIHLSNNQVQLHQQRVLNTALQNTSSQQIVQNYNQHQEDCQFYNQKPQHTQMLGPQNHNSVPEKQNVPINNQINSQNISLQHNANEVQNDLNLQAENSVVSVANIKSHNQSNNQQNQQDNKNNRTIKDGPNCQENELNTKRNHNFQHSNNYQQKYNHNSTFSHNINPITLSNLNYHLNKQSSERPTIKIILPQLQLIKTSIRNLNSAHKGLEYLRKQIQNDQVLRKRIRQRVMNIAEDDLVRDVLRKLVHRDNTKDNIPDDKDKNQNFKQNHISHDRENYTIESNNSGVIQ